MNCKFCDIMAGKEKAHIVFEDKKILCILPKKMEAYGHLLVLPKRHCEDIFDIPEKELKQVMLAVQKLSKKLVDNLDAKGVNILHASGKAAQQSVNHFHIHILPRYKDDKLDTWPKLKEVDADRDILVKKLNI